MLDLPTGPDPDGLTGELNRDRRLDWLVESHLVKVDVRDDALDRVLLVVLEDGVMRGRMALDHHVDDRVETGRPGQRGPKLALTDEDRAGLILAVQDSRDETLPAQSTHASRAALAICALLDLECDPVPGHGRRL
jgi:hypothetical protein